MLVVGQTDIDAIIHFARTFRQRVAVWGRIEMDERSRASIGGDEVTKKGKCHLIPISFVPPDPDHFGVIWTENALLLRDRHEPQSDREAIRRRPIVAAVRGGQSQHRVAQEFHVSQSTVHHWVHHARGQRLDRVDWHNRTHATRTSSRTDPAIEDLVLTVRTELEQSVTWGSMGPPPSTTP
jgi:hypothetical protein